MANSAPVNAILPPTNTILPGGEKGGLNDADNAERDSDNDEYRNRD